MQHWNGNNSKHHMLLKKFCNYITDCLTIISGNRFNSTEIFGSQEIKIKVKNNRELKKLLMKSIYLYILEDFLDITQVDISAIVMR